MVVLRGGIEPGEDASRFSVLEEVSPSGLANAVGTCSLPVDEEGARLGRRKMPRVMRIGRKVAEVGELDYLTPELEIEILERWSSGESAQRIYRSMNVRESLIRGAIEKEQERLERVMESKAEAIARARRIR